MKADQTQHVQATDIEPSTSANETGVKRETSSTASEKEVKRRRSKQISDKATCM